MKRSLLLLVLFITSFIGISNAQVAGDVSVIGMNTDNPDKLLLVTFVDVPAATVIYISDNEWNGAAWNDLNEGIKSYTVVTPLSAGDVVELDLTNSIASNDGTIASESGSLAFGTGGDAVYVYLGVDAFTPSTFLFAVNTNGGWAAGELDNTGLTVDVNALSFTASTDDINYIGPRSGLDMAGYQAAIADVANNWETSGSSYTFDLSSFALGVAGPSLVIVDPADGTTIYTSTVTYNFDVQNFVLSADASGDGYIMLYDNLGGSQACYTNTLSVGPVPAGTYTITAVLVDNSGIAIVPTVTYTTTFTVILPETLDWYNLQWPANGTIDEGGVFDVYAQAYELGLTDQVGQGAGVDVWIGYNTENTDPSTWTNWISATYGSDQGNNDEYTVDLGSALSAGTYYYASRFQLNGSVYTYGGYAGGAWDGVNNVSGVLTVNVVPQTTTLPYAEDFAIDLGQNYTYNVLGATKEWYYTGYSASMNGYNSGETEEDWLILPGINFDNYSNEIMTFNSWYNYGTDDANNYLKLVYSTDYAGIGDPSSATWTEIPYTQPASSNTWSGTGDIDLSGITGTMVYIAFKYHYESGSYRSWSVDDFSIYEGAAGTAPIISNVSAYPGAPTSSDMVDILALITDDGTIASANMFWGTVSGTYTQTISMTDLGAGVYTTTASIPAMANGTTVYVVVEATDDAAYTTTSTEYYYTVTDPATPQTTTIPYTEDFATDLGQNYTYNVLGATKEWYHNGSFASMNGYNSGETEEDWLILPGINFDNYSNEVMTFNSWYNYGTDNVDNYLKLVYSTDYAGVGDPSSATWTELSYTQPGSSSTWTASGDIDLSAITGTMVYIAFKYRYEAGMYRSWSVDDFSIIEDIPSTIPEITNVMYSPMLPNSSESVTVSADITDDGTISMAQLSWGTVSGTYTQTISMTSVAGNTYTSTTDIPAMANGTTVYFQIYAEDNDTYSSTTMEYSYTVFDMPSQTLFFSEYIEGSGQNKALEIYNGTGATVDLTNYRVAYANNGGDWSAWHTFTVTTSLGTGDVIVIAAEGCDAAIAAVADEILSYPDVVFYNGDDAIALEMTSDGGTTWNIVDIIGDPIVDPGSGWDVAGTTNGTSDHTLVRKYPDVTTGNTDWTASAGTNVGDSEWLVFDQDDFSYIGWHGEMPTNPTLVIVTPFDGSTVYTSTVSVDLNVQNFAVGTDGYIVVDLNGISFDVYTTTFDFANVPVGTYTMTATLVDNAGTPIVPTVSDVVTFYVDQTTLVSIHDIQYTTVAGDGTYPSTYAGMTVQTSGIVTAVDADGQYFIQDGDGGWNGVYVYDFGNTVNLGDDVLLTATVTEYNGLTELSSVSGLQIVSSGNTLPNVQVLSTLEANDEQYEGVLIRVTAECTNADAGFGMWTVNDGSGDLLVDDDLFTYTATATFSYEVTGVGHYSYGEFKILPRNIDDIIEIWGIDEQQVQISVYPNPAVNVVNISGDVQNVELFSALGQKMNAQYSNNTINVEGLTAGVYVLRITLNDGNVVTKQIIKK